MIRGFAMIRDVSHMFRACFAMFRKIHEGITHVSRMFRACFAMFRGVSQDSLMIRGFAMIRDVSRMFRRCETW